ncbi:short-chain dehydrogenase/reductase SDR [Reticulomyxa filosa]|uniref:Short-chain dehydrogenase/reductase SDR n=1 Tax=Reticulomyxa filosa TaxID=46433 RepID=X6MKD7_RETFI|nr:short-chain dehydrogenase/reductase SDR [Reticulomyxa filosa]|eukprot:ETO13535.1 short-chain dehydrogenase/reductase SDR [Reticulomyxa filosa]
MKTHKKGLNCQKTSVQNGLISITIKFACTWNRLLSEDLEWCLRRLGLDVTVVNPGWVKTPMLDKLTSNYRWMFALEPEACARTIRDGLERNVGYIDFPWNVMFMSWYIGGLHPILRAIVAYTCCRMPMRWIRRKFPPNPSQIKLRSYANSLLKLRQQPELINAMLAKILLLLCVSKEKDGHQRGQLSAMLEVGSTQSRSTGDFGIRRELLQAPISPHFRSTTPQAFGPLSVPSFHTRGVSAFGAFDLQIPGMSNRDGLSNRGQKEGPEIQIMPSSIGDDAGARLSHGKSSTLHVPGEVSNIDSKNGSLKENRSLRPAQKIYTDLSGIPENRENSVSEKGSKKQSTGENSTPTNNAQAQANASSNANLRLTDKSSGSDADHSHSGTARQHELDAIPPTTTNENLNVPLATHSIQVSIETSELTAHERDLSTTENSN